MPLDNPRGGIGYAAEFQSSALPWVTSSTAPSQGSPLHYDFPKVTRFITVTNRDLATSGSISFGFTESGVKSTNNKWIVNGGSSITLELRVKKIFLQGEVGTGPFSLCVGLTNVDARQMPVLTGTLPGAVPGWDGVG